MREQLTLGMVHRHCRWRRLRDALRLRAYALRLLRWPTGGVEWLP